MPIAVAAIAATGYAQLEPKPDRSTINQGLTSPTASFMESRLGVPGALTKDRSPATDPALKFPIVTQRLGPFRATGLRPATEADGMLCVSQVRRGSDVSSHSWSTAIEIKISGKGDVYGDDKAMVGLRQFYPYFHAEGFCCGAGFSRKEDSMHFEVAQQLIT